MVSSSFDSRCFIAFPVHVTPAGISGRNWENCLGRADTPGYNVLARSSREFVVGRRQLALISTQLVTSPCGLVVVIIVLITVRINVRMPVIITQYGFYTIGINCASRCIADSIIEHKSNSTPLKMNPLLIQRSKFETVS